MCAAFGVSFLEAQEISLYNIDASGFPKITANYIAFDETLQPYTALTERDFRVTETTSEGASSDVTPSITHSCVATSSTSSMSLVLVVDESFSMDQALPTGRRRIDYVKDALRRLVSELDWNGETAVSIIGFSGRSRLLCDWQTSPAGVLDAIGRMAALGATNYEAPFVNPPSVFEQFENRPPDIPKVAFFITDGFPNPEIANRPAFEERAIMQSRAQGIRLYSVTLMIGRTDQSIFRMCQATGGRSLIADEEALVDLMSVLVFETTSRTVCSISWISPMVCNESERLRSATIQLRKGRQPSATTSYATPPESVYRYDVAPSPVVFDEVPFGQRSTASVTVTAVNAPIELTTASVSNPEFFQIVDFRPTSLARGQSATFTVAFTPDNARRTRQAILSFGSTPRCLRAISLVAGNGAVVLTTPNGGELLSTCSETVITWTGVGADQAVRLEFTCDGVSWRTIADTVFGTSFTWLPDEGCSTARIRVSTLPGERLLWAKQIGGTANELLGGIATPPDGRRVYVGGSFNGSTQIGPFTAQTQRDSYDGFVAGITDSGAVAVVTHLRGQFGTDERVTAIRADAQGNVYVGGHSNSARITFGTTTWDAGPIDESTGFLIKLDPDGRVLWRLALRGTLNRSANNTVDAIVLRQQPDNSTEVLVLGRAENVLSVVDLSERVRDEVTLPFNSTWYYTMRVAADGTPRVTTQAQPSWPAIPNPFVADDDNGYRYQADVFENDITVPILPTVRLLNKGQRDIWVARSALSIPTDDVSDQTFRIQQPLLSTALTSVTFDSTAIDRSTTYSHSAGLRNTGSAPLTIDSVRIVGPHAGDFALIDDVDSLVIEPGSSISIELRFTPSAVGLRTATLEVFASCRNLVRIDLQGEGRPECPWELQDTINLGQVIVGTASTQRFACILRSQRRILMPSVIRLRSTSDFTMTPQGPVSLRFNQCVTVDVTFRPSRPGPQTAVIEMNLPTECGFALVTVLAEGVQPELVISDVDFGNHRLQTRAEGAVRLSNNGVVAATVQECTVLDSAGTGIRVSVPAVPLIVQAGESVDIPVEFSPLVRGSHRARVAVRYSGADTVLVGTIRGAGYQPLCEARGYRFAPLLVGTTSAERGVVRLYNRDEQWPLLVGDVRFADVQADFAWAQPLPVLPLVIPPKDSLDVGVWFSAQAPGPRQVLVVVTHDGVAGAVPPYVDTVVVVEGVGLQPGTLPPVDFDELIWCISDVKVVTVLNDLPGDLEIFGVAVTGDADVFVVQPSAPFVIGEGQSQVVTIQFVPNRVGSFAARVNLENSRLLDLSIDVTASAVSANMGLQMLAPQRASVASTMALPLRVSIPFVNGIDVDVFTVLITYDGRAAKYARHEAGGAVGWVVTSERVGVNELELTYRREAGVIPVNDVEFSLAFDVLLAPVESMLFSASVHSELECVDPANDAKRVGIDFTCADAKRVVSVSAQGFGMAQPYIGIDGSIVVDYAIGLGGAAQVSLIDVQGRVHHQEQIAHAIAGEHTVHIPESVSRSGWFAIVLESGPYRAIRTVSVSR